MSVSVLDSYYHRYEHSSPILLVALITQIPDISCMAISNSDAIFPAYLRLYLAVLKKHTVQDNSA